VLKKYAIQVLSFGEDLGEAGKMLIKILKAISLRSRS